MLGVCQIAKTFVRGCRSSDVEFPSRKYLKAWGRIHEVRGVNYKVSIGNEFLVVCWNMQWHKLWQKYSDKNAPNGGELVSETTLGILHLFTGNVLLCSVNIFIIYYLFLMSFLFQVYIYFFVCFLVNYTYRICSMSRVMFVLKS